MKISIDRKKLNYLLTGFLEFEGTMFGYEEVPGRQPHYMVLTRRPLRLIESPEAEEGLRDLSLGYGSACITLMHNKDGCPLPPMDSQTLGGLDAYVVGYPNIKVISGSKKLLKRIGVKIS